MFYAYECLTKKGKFAVIWMAVNRNGKVSKAACLGVDVNKSCDDLLAYIPNSREANRGPRFSLYLCSQLTLGIVQILHKQIIFLLQDVSHLHDNVKRPVLPATPRPKKLRTSDADPVTLANSDLNKSPHKGSREGSVVGRNIWDPIADNLTDGAAFFDGFELMEIIVQSSTDHSGDTQRGQKVQNRSTLHQAREEDITMVEALPDFTSQPLAQDEANDLQPLDEDQLRHFEEIEADIRRREGDTEKDGDIRGQRVEQTPDNVHHSDSSAPNAPPRSLTPPLDEPNRTAAPEEQEDPIPSLALHLDNVSPPPKKKKKGKAPPPVLNLDGASRAGSEAPQAPQPPPPVRPPISISIPSADLKTGLNHYSDTHFHNEAERSEVHEVLPRNHKLAEIQRFLFTPDSYVPGYFLVQQLKRNLDDRLPNSTAASVAALTAPTDIPEELRELWRQGGEEREEEPRGMEEMMEENPWVIRSEEDPTFDFRTSADLRMELDALNPTLYTSPERGRDKSAKDATLEGHARHSSGLNINPDGLAQEDMTLGQLEAAVDAGFLTMEESAIHQGDMNQQLDPETEAPQPEKRPWVGKYGEATETFGLTASDLLTEVMEKEEGGETLFFTDFCPEADSTRPKAAKTFYAFLELAKSHLVELEQVGGTFDPITIIPISA